MISRSWILWCVVFIHTHWGILLIIDERAKWATAVHSISLNTLPNWFSGVFLIFISMLCAWGLLRGVRKFSTKELFFIIPQQILLIESCLGAINASLTSQFADGVIRPMAFIMADQAPYIWLAIFHAFGFLDHFAPGVRRKIWKALGSLLRR